MTLMLFTVWQGMYYAVVGQQIVFDRGYLSEYQANLLE